MGNEKLVLVGNTEKIMVNKTLGQLLVESEALTQEQFVKFKEEAQKSNLSFTRYVHDKHLVAEEGIAKAYIAMTGLTFINQLTDEMADPLLLAKVPLKFLRENMVIPIKHQGIALVTANPTDFQPIDELQLLFGSDITILISTPKIILDALNHYYPLEGTDEMMEDLEKDSDVGDLTFADIDERDILSSANDAPIIKLVNYILFQADKLDASDVHIEPEEKEIRVRFRVDGRMHQFMTVPKRMEGAVASRIKIMSSLDIAEKRKPQDGRIEIRIGDKRIDLRVSFLPAVHGESIVMRLLDKDKGFSELDKLGLSERDYKIVLKSIARPNGIFLVSGPTGSGKTTTLYSILSRINVPTVNIITVENPVEYQLPGITQVQVNPKVDLTFSSSLRSILRQDPDIVMIGETRDQETAQIAIQAALTGHLVLTTIHTNDAPSIITRLIDMGIEPFLIASSIVAGMAQRLVRKLDPACKEAYKPSAEVLKSLGMNPTKNKDVTFYKPKGCKDCNMMGYKGRLPIFEVMDMTDAVAQLTMKRAPTLDIRKQAKKDGMTYLIDDGIAKIKAGLTSVEEVVSVATVFDDSSSPE
ncbi:MAG: type II secretion system protein E [Alteromonas naphthalenivorans]|jgi:type II secretion system protein E